MQLHPTPENPLPSEAACVALRTPDGISLRAMHAKVDNPRGTVVLIGGRGDFLERYFETIRDLLGRGFCVASVDLRGQGGSQRLTGDPYRGHVKSFRLYETDVETLMTQTVLRHCPRPYYGLGHSTGGLIMLQVARRHHWFEKVVVASPLAGLLYGSWPRPVAALLSLFVNALGLGHMFLPGQLRRPLGRGDYDHNPLTSDRWRWQRDSGVLELAPHLGLGGATFGWLRAARRSLAELARMTSREKFNAPVLIVASGQDRVVDNEAIRKLARRVPGVALCMVPGAQHELLAEADEFRTQFLAAFDSFVAAGPPAGSA